MRNSQDSESKAKVEISIAFQEYVVLDELEGSGFEGLVAMDSWD